MTVTRLDVQRRPAPGPGRPQRPQRPREAAVDPEAPAKTLSRTARRAAAEDAKLLAAIRMLLSNPSVFPRVFYLAFGFAAITSLGAALAGLVPLPYLFHLAVIPAYAIMMAALDHERPRGDQVRHLGVVERAAEQEIGIGDPFKARSGIVVGATQPR